VARKTGKKEESCIRIAIFSLFCNRKITIEELFEKKVAAQV
jgi:hypothetical protein